MAMRVCTSEDCPCSSHHLRYLLYIGEFVLYTRDLVSGTEAEERGRKVEKVLSHGGIRLEPKVEVWLLIVDMISCGSSSSLSRYVSRSNRWSYESNHTQPYESNRWSWILIQL